MGLSSRKEKQRIPADPRNLTWADDAAKFGSNYLSKFGWDSSKGLGVDGDGRKSHIKVSHKLDMLGIGAAHQKDPNGIAWKQNKDFENLLKRLNASKAEEVTEAPVEVVEVAAEDSDTGKGEKKRKWDKGQEEFSEKTKIKRKKISKDEHSTDTPQIPLKPFIPRHRAHRARVIASKSIAFKSASAISEILGIAPTPSTSATAAGSATPQGKLTPLGDDLTIEKITTSTKSVADYFKDKLLAKSSKLSSATPISTPEYEVVHEQDSYDTPRRGLGSSHFPRDKREDPLDTETRRMGISKFSSLMSSSFLAATITTISLEEGKATTHVKPSDDNLDTVMEHESLDDEEEKKRRNKDSAADVVDDEDRVKAKEERRRARAERRALREKGRNSSSAKQAS